MKYDIEKFFNLSVDMLCIAGVDGYFKRLNPAFQRTLGWSLEELLSRPFYEFIHPEDVERTIAEIEKLGGGEPTVSFEHRFSCADGGYKCLVWAAHPEPETGLLYAVARDVTELKRAQERFRLAVESSPAAAVMVDEAGAIVLVNQEAERLFSYDRGELLGRSVDVLLPERFRGRHEQQRLDFFHRLKSRPMGRRRDLTARRKDGLEFPVEIGLNPVETEEGTFVLSSIIDLTERKRAEDEQTRLINELQSALSEIKELRGLIPICSMCKKVRADEHYWQDVDAYLREHTAASFSHGVCPDCGPKLYGDLYEDPAKQ